MTYIVSGGSLNSTHSLTHLLVGAEKATANAVEMSVASSWNYCNPCGENWFQRLDDSILTDSAAVNDLATNNCAKKLVLFGDNN